MRSSEAEVDRALESLPGWSRHGAGILRTFVLSDFRAAIAFVQKVALIANEMDHNPDIDVRFSRVILWISTHDENGLTDLDFELASRINAMPA